MIFCLCFFLMLVVLGCDKIVTDDVAGGTGTDASATSDVVVDDDDAVNLIAKNLT